MCRNFKSQCIMLSFCYRVYEVWIFLIRQLLYPLQTQNTPGRIPHKIYAWVGAWILKGPVYSVRGHKRCWQNFNWFRCYDTQCDLLLHLVPGARMSTARAQGRSCVYGVKKSLRINKIILKHLIQMFHCSMEECGSAASEVQCI